MSGVGVRQRANAKVLIAVGSVSVAMLAAAGQVHAQYADTTEFTPGGTDVLWSNPENWSNGVPDGSTLAIVTTNTTSQVPPGITIYGARYTVSGNVRIDPTSGGTLTLLSTDSVNDPDNNRATALSTADGSGEFDVRPNVILGDGSVPTATYYFGAEGGVLLVGGSIKQAEGTVASLTIVGDGETRLRASNSSGNYMVNRYDFSGPLTVSSGAVARLHNNVLPYGVGLPNVVVDGTLRHAQNGGAVILNALDSNVDTAVLGRNAGNNVVLGANGNDGTFLGQVGQANNTRIFKIGAGNQTFTNDTSLYGRLTLIEGTVTVDSFADTGTASAAGSAADGADGLVFDGGTLRYAGADATGHSTNRLFSIGLRGGTLDASGSGALVFTGAGNAASTDTAFAFGDALASGTSQVVSNMYGIAGLASKVAAGQLTVSADTNTTITAGALPVEINETERTMTLPEGSTVNAAGNGFGAPMFTFTANTAIDRTLTLTGTSTAANTITPVLTDSSAGGKLGITKSGSGTWVLKGANTYTGETVVQDGTLELGLSAHAPVLSGPGGADIQGGRIVFDYTDGVSPAADVLAILDAGYDVNFATGQIRSSTMAAGYALGWVDDTLGSKLTIAYTLLGDANLDGQVDSGDFGILAGNWLGSDRTWATADFNYDGVVDSGDFGILAGNWNSSVSLAAAAAALNFDLSAVPEPGSLGLLAVAAVAGMRRRRRRVDALQ